MLQTPGDKEKNTSSPIFWSGDFLRRTVIADYDLYYDCTTILSKSVLWRNWLIKSAVLFEGDSTVLLPSRLEDRVAGHDRSGQAVGAENLQMVGGPVVAPP